MVILIPNALTLDDSMIRYASRRFQEAFGLAWVRIPADAQAIIAGYLASRPGRVFMCYRMDLVEKEPEPWGRCIWQDDSTFMTFLAPSLRAPNRLMVSCPSSFTSWRTATDAARERGLQMTRKRR